MPLVARMFRIREDQDLELRALPGKMIEHVRRAIDDYLLKQRTQDVSASKSNVKGGK